MPKLAKFSFAKGVDETRLGEEYAVGRTTGYLGDEVGLDGRKTGICQGIGGKFGWTLGKEYTTAPTI